MKVFVHPEKDSFEAIAMLLFSSLSVRTWNSASSTAAVQFHVSEFVDHEQVDPAVAGDRAGQVLLIGRLDQFVHQPGRERVFHPEPLFGCGGAQPDQEVTLSGARVADEAERLPATHPFAGGESVRWSPG